MGKNKGYGGKGILNNLINYRYYKNVLYMYMCNIYK